MHDSCGVFSTHIDCNHPPPQTHAQGPGSCRPAGPRRRRVVLGCCPPLKHPRPASSRLTSPRDHVHMGGGGGGGGGARTPGRCVPPGGRRACPPRRAFFRLKTARSSLLGVFSFIRQIKGLAKGSALPRPRCCSRPGAACPTREPSSLSAATKARPCGAAAKPRPLPLPAGRGRVRFRHRRVPSRGWGWGAADPPRTY